MAVENQVVMVLELEPDVIVIGGFDVDVESEQIVVYEDEIVVAVVEEMAVFYELEEY